MIFIFEETSESDDTDSSDISGLDSIMEEDTSSDSSPESDKESDKEDEGPTVGNVEEFDPHEILMQAKRTEKAAKKLWQQHKAMKVKNRRYKSNKKN